MYKFISSDKTRALFILPTLLVMVFLSGCTHDESDTSDVKDSSSGSDVDETLSFNITDSSQDRCYDAEGEIVCPSEGEAFFGQDAQYSTNPLSYMDNGDGTISDNVTGLMWEQGVNSGHIPQDDAITYCSNLDFAGYTDWRLPSVTELFSISNFEIGWPYLNYEYFELTADSITKDEQYWSSNYYEAGALTDNEGQAFGVNYGTGHIKAYPAYTEGPMAKNAKCVRGEEYGINELVENDDRTVSDLATGLMWEQDGSSTGMDWENALAYCENSETAGYDDWRLPGVKELQSIVDYSGVFPANDPMFTSTSMINEAGNEDYGYYWTSTSAYYNTNQLGYYYAWYVAFGMATGQDGLDSHGAGAVRYDTKYEGGPTGEDAERIYNFVRCTRGNTTLVEVTDSGIGNDVVSEYPMGEDSAPQGGGAPQDSVNLMGKPGSDMIEGNSAEALPMK